MPHSLRTHGVLLRRLTEHLDGAVERWYARAGLDYRPRFTPIVRALLERGPLSLRALSDHIGVSHSAVSQTVAQMVAKGWVAPGPGRDGRERIIALTPFAMQRLPLLERCWAETETASRTLDADIGQPLADVLIRALDALERRPFADRLSEASAQPSGDNL